MNLIALCLLALAMSTDAFAAAIGKGAGLRNPPLTEALKIGLIFGTIEAITPLIGWSVGHLAAGYVQAWDHWIAFVLLAGLGLHMIHQSLGGEEHEPDRPPRRGILRVAVTAVGTSIDAMAVGVGLAFVEVNILLAAGLIGLATFIMVTLGIMLGRVLGGLIGKRAETAGGAVLILVGCWILASHLQG
ncbi:manganese efflux pump MntP [Bowmanella dokdonensis]|uniref:Putative manganese efflux pump MntP n=1 Tax=Bowmanella dokdonensis TaxID=751969 RepID=A0A939INX8_9ALTE|nr:manganese efflux pump MntP family protein [Bowmanella dokdonensis]MBN7825315.1 manganese efflux pump [Bowmanella dokdonensis]